MGFFEACLDEVRGVRPRDIPNGGLVVGPDDELATAFLGAFSQSSLGPLPENFNPLHESQNPFADAEAIQKFANIRSKAREVLGRLPFVDNDDIDWQRIT